MDGSVLSLRGTDDHVDFIDDFCMHPLYRAKHLTLSLPERVVGLPLSQLQVEQFLGVRVDPFENVAETAGVDEGGQLSGLLTARLIAQARSVHRDNVLANDVYQSSDTGGCCQDNSVLYMEMASTFRKLSRG